jgi:hypothetical protein
VWLLALAVVMADPESFPAENPCGDGALGSPGGYDFLLLAVAVGVRTIGGGSGRQRRTDEKTLKKARSSCCLGGGGCWSFLRRGRFSFARTALSSSLVVHMMTMTMTAAGSHAPILLLLVCSCYRSGGGTGERPTRIETFTEQCYG